MVGNVYYVTKYKLMYSMVNHGKLQNYVDEKGISEHHSYTVYIFLFPWISPCFALLDIALVYTHEYR